ncbi:hypothetical protein SAY86_025891 [Trapa natans]|uniref:Uncharacterized protein n=1 Tax=Trapa natans TaxID=22666 RepID=A0AAN7KD99_TRANT|nr:hypothetical protein SAY86_025891 [Trapa natans]
MVAVVLSRSPTCSLPSRAFLPATSSSAASIPRCSRFQSSCCLTSGVSCPSIRLRGPFLPFPRTRPGLCLAASPGPGVPGPPPDEEEGKGLWSSLYKLQNTVQIFFAVLFWMSLFFWASAWDGRNRPSKGPRFKR